MEPNRNDCECGLCQQDANGPPPGTPLFFCRELMYSRCYHKGIWLASGHGCRQADQLTPWALSADTSNAELNPAVSQKISTSLLTLSGRGFLLVGVSEGINVKILTAWTESLKSSWRWSFCYFGVNKIKLEFYYWLSKGLSLLNKSSQYFREMILYSWLKKPKKLMKKFLLFVSTDVYFL